MWRSGCCREPADHKITHDHRPSVAVLSAGFTVELLEYCDDTGRFHFHPWDVARGPVYRPLRLDHRNRGDGSASLFLILDAREPLDAR